MLSRSGRRLYLEAHCHKPLQEDLLNTVFVVYSSSIFYATLDTSLRRGLYEAEVRKSNLLLGDFDWIAEAE